MKELVARMLNVVLTRQTTKLSAVVPKDGQDIHSPDAEDRRQMISVIQTLVDQTLFANLVMTMLEMTVQFVPALQDTLEMPWSTVREENALQTWNVLGTGFAGIITVRILALELAARTLIVRLEIMELFAVVLQATEVTPSINVPSTLFVQRGKLILWRRIPPRKRRIRK